jgi:hypothetical protein
MKRAALAGVLFATTYGCGHSSPTAPDRAILPAPMTLAITGVNTAPGSSLAAMRVGFDSGTAFKMVAFPPRNEPFAFRQQLDAIYQNQLHRPASSTFVDLEGDIVWTQEYLRYRLSGCSHAQAVQYVLAEIDGAAGAPECGGNAAFPPRNEPFDFRANALEGKYRDGLRRPLTSTYVDLEGDIVWTMEYLRYRVMGSDHNAAVLLVLDQVGGSTSVPKPERTP